MAQKLSRQDAFELLQKAFIEECEFIAIDKSEEKITSIKTGARQCKSLEELVGYIVNTRTIAEWQLLGLYAVAFIEAPEKPPTA